MLKAFVENSALGLIICSYVEKILDTLHCPILPIFTSEAETSENQLRLLSNKEDLTDPTTIFFPRGDIRTVLFINKNISTAAPIKLGNIEREFQKVSVEAIMNELTPFNSLRIGERQTLNLEDLDAETLENFGLLSMPKWILDTALASSRSELKNVKAVLQKIINTAQVLVVPLSRIPGRPGEGGIVLDVRNDNGHAVKIRDQFANLLTKDEFTDEFNSSANSLKSSLFRSFGVLNFMTEPTALPDQTVVTLTGGAKLPRPLSVDHCWPKNDEESDIFTRASTETRSLPDVSGKGIFIARADAVLDNFPLHEAKVIWVAGLKTWRKLCQRGIWVNGTTESLGEFEENRLAPLFTPASWIKLTHEQGIPSPGVEIIPSYSLTPARSLSDLTKKTHFYWKSHSLFMYALEKFPGIIAAFHSSGPGHTYETLRKYISQSRIQVFLSIHDWRKEFVVPRQIDSFLHLGSGGNSQPELESKASQPEGGKTTFSPLPGEIGKTGSFARK